MLNEIQAQAKVKTFVPGSQIKAWARYKNFYLIQIEWPSKEEKNFDPYFSVDMNTGEVKDFSILSDLDTVLNLSWTDVTEGGDHG